MNHPSQRDRREQALPALDRFFEQQSRGASLATQMRNDRVRDRLMEFLAEADMSRCLDLRENAQLAATRARGDGFFGVFGLEELLVCLVRFVDDDWLLEPVTDARAQVMLAGRLAAWLQRSGLLDRDLLGCAAYETEAAVEAARVALGSSRKEPPAADRPALRLIRGGRADP
ncbi:hypothetical protein [Aeromicrobium chenweiae]|uniref:Uncharacterized protein n=1 Tax=Aeromicrobium chenweiae TaxID=2079793 RepID=A0A2S0WMY2_9ACTN|nr:hypothetical protein [Aeromicrobium chenweiae]AWB92666.1 hypothetical protein C3E78_10900 [Aeromicrobium chenweiae]TGN33655.1 hypothetical protein E4L97_00940 [Aeromicrobium chenweiae]